MSGVSQEAQQTVYLKYGLLAAKSGGLIQALLEARPVDENGLEVLRKAERFLQEVASGADLVTNGVSTSSASESLEVLSYAMDPIEALQQRLQNRQIEVIFKEMAETIHRASTPQDEQLSAANRELLSLAKAFFERLLVSFMGSLEQTRRQSGDFSPLPAKPLMHG